ncbi:MAG: hypothetical protein K2X27_04445 [Candidatus Obscuribacterales bacterium]|nr:hypothetical protein [Candidatus Obscuribacterales bacterium]
MTNDPKQLYNLASGTEALKTGPVLHVRVQGRSRDIALDLLGISAGASDESIKNSVAAFMEISSDLLKHTVIERHENGNLTLRPEAVFG